MAIALGRNEGSRDPARAPPFGMRHLGGVLVGGRAARQLQAPAMGVTRKKVYPGAGRNIRLYADVTFRAATYQSKGR